MNRLIFSAGFLVGSLWGTVTYVYLTSNKHGKDTASDVHRVKREVEDQILKYGAPTAAPAVSYYEGHLLGYDQERKIPRWVAEDITTTKLVGDANRKDSNFRSDTSIPEDFRSLKSDFKGSGWSRGHMAPAADFKFNQTAMDASFLLSNIVPQDINNNGGFWNRFEIYCRELTKTFGHVRVITGPVMMPQTSEDGKNFIKYDLIGKSMVAAPTHLYKVIVAENDANSTEQLPALGAFVVPNEPIDFSHQLAEYKVPLSNVEERTGLHFLPKLNRQETRDLCTTTGCKLMTKTQFELYVTGRKLAGAKTKEKLDKVWKELESKNLEPDEYCKNLYNRRTQEFAEDTATAAKSSNL